jgi:hypothetical protein
MFSNFIFDHIKISTMFSGNEDHSVSLESAAALTAEFRSNNRGARIAGYFSKTAIDSVLKQSNCVGIRIYFGLQPNSTDIEMVIVGADTNEDDLIGTGSVCLDSALPCPARCGTNNVLNSD